MANSINMDNVHHIALYLDHFFHHIRYQEGKTGKSCPLIPSHQIFPPYLILSEKSGKQVWIIAEKSALCEDYNRLIPRVNNMLGFIFSRDQLHGNTAGESTCNSIAPLGQKSTQVGNKLFHRPQLCRPGGHQPDCRMVIIDSLPDVEFISFRQPFNQLVGEDWKNLV